MVKGPGTPFTSGTRVWDPEWIREAAEISIDTGAVLLGGDGARCGSGVRGLTCCRHATPGLPAAAQQGARTPPALNIASHLFAHRAVQILSSYTLNQLPPQAEDYISDAAASYACIACLPACCIHCCG